MALELPMQGPIQGTTDLDGSETRQGSQPFSVRADGQGAAKMGTGVDGLVPIEINHVQTG